LLENLEILLNKNGSFKYPWMLKRKLDSNFTTSFYIKPLKIKDIYKNPKEIENYLFSYA